MLESSGTRKQVIVPTSQGAEQGTYNPSVLVFGKQFPTYAATDFLVNHPILVAILSCLVPFVICVLFLMSPRTLIDRSASGFEFSNHDSVYSKNAYRAAADTWERLRTAYVATAPNIAGLQPTSERSKAEFRLYLIYKIDLKKFPNGNKKPNLFDAMNLQWIRDIEHRITKLPGYEKLCWMNRLKEGGIVMNASDSCAPLNSPLTYFFPGQPKQYQGSYLGQGDYIKESWWNWQWNGVTGSLQQPINNMLDIFFKADNYRWFVDSRASPTVREAVALRSQITLGTPQKSSDGTNISMPETLHNVDKFLRQFVDLMEEVNTHPYISIYYGGDRITEMIILEKLQSDSLYPSLGGLLVLVALWFHTHSLILAISTTMQLIIITPCALYLYQLISGQNEVSLLSSIAIYVLFTLGLDSAMIMFSTFTHSGFMSTLGRNNTLTLKQRMAYMYRKSGVGVCVSNTIAICCFAINTMSPIMAIKRFGGQMVILCSLNMFMFLTFYPAMILIHHFYFSGRRRNMQKKKEILLTKCQRKRHGIFKELLSVQEDLTTRISQRPTASYQTLACNIREATRVEMARRAHTRPNGPQSFLAFTGMMGARSIPPAPPAPPPEEEFDMTQFADAPTASSHAMSTLLLNGRRKPALKGVMNIQLADFWPALDTQSLREQVTGEVDETENDKWRRIATSVGLQYSTPDGVDDYGQPLPAASRAGPFLRSCVDLLRGVTFVGDSTARVAEEECLPSPDEVPSPPPRQAFQPRRFYQVRAKVLDWWEDRRQEPREFCCGLFGKRVNETKEMRERRILAAQVKHEGFTWVERVLLMNIGEGIYRARYVICIGWAALFIAFCYLAVGLQPESKAQSILGSNPLGAFENVVKDTFAIQGSCDFCAAYYRPRSAFPPLDPIAVATCDSQTTRGLQVFSTIDRCGMCNGINSCVDCANVPRGSAMLDDCGQCLPNRNSPLWNKCIDKCTDDPSNLLGPCAFCFPVKGLGWYGPKCSVRCDETTCAANRGVCNSFTGVCECHLDYERGFFQTDPALEKTGPYCTQCLEGFIPEIDSGAALPCIAECNATYPPPPASELEAGRYKQSSCRCQLDRGTCNCQGIIIGPYCQHIWKKKCRFGQRGPYLPTQGTVCICNEGWTGASCDSHTACSKNGILYDADATVYDATDKAGICQCFGAWRGPKCNFCGCRNGGVCSAKGQCICIGAWTGSDCNQCNSNCREGGRCPVAWTPSQYISMQECQGVFCLYTELLTNEPYTSDCIRCYRRELGTCGGLTAPRNGTTATKAQEGTTVVPRPCDDDPSCFWDPFLGKCYVRWNFVPPTQINTACHDCRGSFMGKLCEDCKIPPSLPQLKCRPSDGVLVGCDNLPKGANGQYKFFDACGVCGGSSACSGCDGVAGSKKVLDECGVCGGYNECAKANGGKLARDTAVIKVVFGVRKDTGQYVNMHLTNQLIQEHLLWVCSQLNGNSALSQREKSRCFWDDFKNWLNDENNRVRHGFDSLGFPFTPEEEYLFYRALFLYMQDTGNYDLMGFNTANIDSPQLKCLWFVLEIRTANVYVDESLEHLQELYSYWERLLHNINKPWNVRGTKDDSLSLSGFMVSETWVNMFTRRYAVSGATYTIIVGGFITLFIVLCASCSVLFTLLAMWEIASSLILVLGVFYAVGWMLGPVEQLAMSLLLGICAAHTMHVLEGYLEHLHSAQSHLLARDTTRRQAYKGMLQRVGVPIGFSGWTVLVLSLIQLASDLYVLRKVALIMIIVISVSVLNNLIFLGALVSAVGPTESYRTARLMWMMFVTLGLLIVCVLLVLLHTGGLKDADGRTIT